MTMRILVVGAGAVGQVFCHHAQLGGADVSVLVKPKYADAASAGFDLYPLNRRRSRRADPVRVGDIGVITDASAAGAERWDAVILCVSSTALRTGTWLGELADASGDATWVITQPGIEDYALVCEHVESSRIVSGMVGLAAYATPLTTEQWPRPGVAYWFPPLASFPLGGPAPRVQAVVDVLRRGGLPAKHASDARARTGFGSAIFNTLMAALECADWQFATLRERRDLMALAHRAARQGMDLVRVTQRARPPLTASLIRPSVVRLVLRFARHLAPFDLEAFFRVHFTKVGDQTRLLIETNAALAAERGLRSDALEDLRARLDRVAAPAETATA